MNDHSSDSFPTSRLPRLSVTQVIALGLVAASVGWAAWLVRDRPINEEVELLSGTVLPSSEMAIVEAAFDRAQLADHRTEDGRVWVPRQRQSAYMRALVDAEALPREFGSSLKRALEKNSPWQSRAVQEEMLRVAVQEELAHVICSMPGIERAAVFYDVGERSGFDGGIAAGPVKTASVNVRTQPDAELEPARVQAIRVLVAASIAGLKPDDVAVTDLRSGRVHAGPLVAEEVHDDLAVDPELARRVAHERHLAAKVRQSLTFVKGAVVDVTVTLPVAAPAVPVVVEPPALPEPLRQRGDQLVADANAPAEIAAATAPPAPAPPAIDTTAAASSAGPDTILVSLAIPDGYLRAAAQAALARDPAADAAGVYRRERERLVEHVRGLLPPTPDPDDCRVVVTEFAATPSRSTHSVATVAAPAALAPSIAMPSTSAPPRPGHAHTPGQILDAACQAVAAGDMAAVPREAWLVVIAVSAAVLVWMLLMTASGGRRPERPHRRSQPRIDWNSIDARGDADTVPEESPGGLPRKVAA
jgi:type III secretory pathway lipoprotein EscJ